MSRTRLQSLSGDVSDFLGTFVADDAGDSEMNPLPRQEVEPAAKTEEVLAKFDEAICRVSTQLSLYQTLGVKEEAEKCEAAFLSSLQRTLHQVDQATDIMANLQRSLEESYPADLRIEDLKLAAEYVNELRFIILDLSKAGERRGSTLKEAEVADDLYKIAQSVQKLWELYKNAKAEKYLLKDKLNQVEKQIDWGKGLAYNISLPILLPVWLVAKVVKQASVSAQEFVEQFVKGHSPAHVTFKKCYHLITGTRSGDSGADGQTLGDSLKFECSSDGVVTSTPRSRSTHRPFDDTSYTDQPGFDAADSGISTSFHDLSRKRSPSPNRSRRRSLTGRALNKSSEILKLALEYGGRPITYRRNIIFGLIIYACLVLAVVIYYFDISIIGSGNHSRPRRSFNLIRAILNMLSKFASLRRVGPVPT